MFAFFGLGVPELIILAVIATVCIGVPILTVVVVFTLTRPAPRGRPIGCGNASRDRSAAG